MNHLDVKDENLYLISILDYTQELAVKMANKSKSLIINGTNNKDMAIVIANIISNSLYKEKKVLLVYNEANKINDLYKELTYISDKILLLPESDIKLNNFNDNITTSLNNLSKNTGMTTLSKINVLSRDISRKFELLENIYKLFHTPSSSGLTLIDMYKLTGNKLATSDSLYNYYKIYRIRKPFLNYKYNNLKDVVDKLLNDNNINNYVKYRRFINHKLFSKLISNINNEDIASSKSKIKSLLNNELSFELPLNNWKYTDDFISAFLINNNLNNESIKKLSKYINLEYNSYMINNTTEIKKWNPTYWIKRASIIKNNEKNRILFDTLESTIYLECIDNLNNINIFIGKFEFIKNIVHEDEYSNFLNSLLTGDDIIEYLTNLLNVLDVYESFSKVTKDIKYFTDIEIEILNYCYDNMERKDEIKILLKEIPNFYIFYNIEDIETREKDTLNNYKSFEIILKDIQLSIQTMNSFVPYAIKHIWDNKVSQILSIKNSNSRSITDYLELNEFSLQTSDFFTTFQSIIFSIYPCCIINYKKLNEILPDAANLFDIIIWADNKSIYKENIKFNNATSIIISDDYEEDTISFINTYGDGYSLINLKDCNEYDNNFKKSADFKSYLQREIYNVFKKLGYKLKINVQSYGFIFNLVFYNNNEILLIVECDDIIYNNTYNAKEVDLYTRNYLDNIGYSVLRIWCRDWWLNKFNEIKRIKNILDGLLSKF